MSDDDTVESVCFRSALRQIFKKALIKLSEDGIVAIHEDELLSLIDQVREAADPKFGDYSGTMAMPLAKKAGKKPREIAAAIIDRLEVGALFEKPLEPVGPGFINVRIRDEALSQAIVTASKDSRLGIEEILHPEVIIVDYSSPNVAKPMHVGHIRSTVIGHALANLLKFRGHQVITDNHLGDWGTQFGMILWGWKHLRNERAFDDNPTDELGRLYRLVRKLIDKDPSEFIEDGEAAGLLEKFPDVGQEVLLETAKLHEGDEENRRLWEKFIPICRHEIDRIYMRLDVSFDHWLGESFFQPMLGAVVEELSAKGLAKEARGALGVFLNGEDQPPFLVRKADGAFLYATTDLATLQWRHREWKPDRILYVVDHRQGQHFKQLFETARRWGLPNLEKVKLEHVAFGTVLGEDGKPFKTRAGDAVGLEPLLDEGVARAFDVVTSADLERGTHMSEAERLDIAEAVGLGAIKYADLSQNRTTDYVFSFDKMLELKGNTAAYMQYAVARVDGIFSKGGIDREQVRDKAFFKCTDKRERALAVKLLRFGEVLEDVESDYRPNLLTSWLFEVACAYSSFYDALPVLKASGEQKSTRLTLCDLTGRSLRLGLELLGIQVPKRM